MSGTNFRPEEWTEEKCILLINEFRKRPILWDKTDIHFYQNEIKWHNWEEVAKVVNVKADRCRHKMGILLSSFRREKARVNNSMKLGDPSKVYTSLWFGWKHMMFLLDNKSERQRQCEETIQDRVDHDDIIAQIISNDYYENEEEKEKTSDEYTTQTASTKRSATVQKEGYQLKRARKQAKICATPTTSAGPSKQMLSKPSETSDDELNFFSTFLASKMRKYSEVTKNAVQQAICNIIFKADETMHGSRYESQCQAYQSESSVDLSEDLIHPDDIKICYSDSE